MKATGNKEINKDNVQAMYFQCNRSGCTRSSTGKLRKRRMKSQGNYFANTEPKCRCKVHLNPIYIAEMNTETIRNSLRGIIWFITE